MWIVVVIERRPRHVKKIYDRREIKCGHLLIKIFIFVFGNKQKIFQCDIWRVCVSHLLCPGPHHPTCMCDALSFLHVTSLLSDF